MLLNNWKLYLLILSIFFNLGLYYQLHSFETKLQNCKDNVAYMQTAINYANDLKAQQEQDLKQREREAAAARIESLKRSERIKDTPIQEGCENANDFLKDFALHFHWDNDIP